MFKHINKIHKYGNFPGEEGGATMGYLSKINKKVLVAFAGAAIALAALVPMVANAAPDWPGAEEGDFTGTTATTQVNLKVDDSKLSFTAPTVINFTMDGAGNFITPDPGVAYIQNKSVMDIKVVSFAVTCKNGATGVSSVSGKTTADTYAVNVKGTTGDAVPFAVNSPTDWTGWTLKAAGAASSADKVGLTFSDGVMINPTASKWHNGNALQDVTWTLASAS